MIARASRFKNILVPVGVVRPLNPEPGEPLAAPGSLHAAELAGELAAEQRATIHLLYVVPRFAMTVAGWDAQPDPEDSSREIFVPNEAGGIRRVSPESVAKEKLEEVAAQHLPRGVAHRVLTRIGQPGKGIVAAAKEADIDLVVMPRHRHRGVLREFLLGKVTYEVVRSVPCDVWVLAEDERSERDSTA